ncbi:hypothetical protein L7F22_015415 [Adiantum nelumboides]|nr:hypothetical protein [Adiantum nelumboides]
MSDSGVPSLPSPKIRFKDLDIEFLQRQTRIWLEVVVGERYDQSTSLPSLLANGSILRKVSSRIWELIQKNGDKESVGTSILFPETSANGKHSGRYLPYSNIDTFLKVCQKVGLTGLDLFSPPDVVEGKDIRRVCLCIRALSQKARARNLKVPNFDSITHSEAVPTGLVAGFKAFNQHLSAENSESKDTPDQKGTNGRSSFMLQKLRKTDKKGSSNESPFINLSSSLERPNINIRDKLAEADKSSNLVKTLDANCTSRHMNGLKPLKVPSSFNISPPSSSCEEVHKSTNDFKASNSGTDVFYEGFMKHKANRSAPLVGNQNSKPSKQALEHAVAQYANSLANSQPTIGYASTSSDGESSEELSCTMDSYNVDTDASQNETNDENEEIHEQDSLPILIGSCGEKDGVKNVNMRRRTIWRPLVTMAIALFGAMFIMKSRNSKVSDRLQKINTTCNIPKPSIETNVENASSGGDEQHGS